MTDVVHCVFKGILHWVICSSGSQDHQQCLSLDLRSPSQLPLSTAREVAGAGQQSQRVIFWWSLQCILQMRMSVGFGLVWLVSQFRSCLYCFNHTVKFIATAVTKSINFLVMDLDLNVINLLWQNKKFSRKVHYLDHWFAIKISFLNKLNASSVFFGNGRFSLSMM